MRGGTGVHPDQSRRRSAEGRAMTGMLDLPSHHLSVALLQPQIAPNTGNVARLCVATGTELHLARPLGFVLSDRELRRSAMDYWPRLRLTVHDDTPALLAASTPDTRWLL